MFYDDQDENQEWQKDLNSWKKRRKSASSLKQRFNDDDDDDDGGGDDNDLKAMSTKPREMEVSTKNKSLKNRKWNQFRSNDDDDYDDDAFKRNRINNNNNTNHQQRHHHQQQPSSSSSSSSSPPVSSSSSTWRPKEMHQRQRDAGALRNDDDDDDDDHRHQGIVKNVAQDEYKALDNHLLQEKIIKINQRPNNPKGFGFEFDLGQDKQLPVTIARVVRGSSADICGLRSGDIVESLNNIEVRSRHRNSVASVVDEAVRKGLVELKIKRFRNLSEDALSDDDDEMRLNPPTSRWSGSQSSYRSTPPLPPQPDHTNDCFSESPPPLPLTPPLLPLAPPPAVNWSTFPEGGMPKSASGEITPTENGHSVAHESNINFMSSIRGRISPPSPDYAESSSSQSSVKPSDQLRETLTFQKFKFLGLQPEQSEELKLLKEKNKFLDLRHETTFPVTSDSDEGYNSHKYVAEFSATEPGTRRNKLSRREDSKMETKFESSSDHLADQKIRIANKGKHDFEGHVDGHAVSTSSQTHRYASSLQAGDDKKTNKVDKEFREKRHEFKSSAGSQVDNWISKSYKDENTKNKNLKKTFETDKNSNIEKVEVSRNAAAEWKKRDKELKEKEEKEKKTMQDRFDKFNKEGCLPSFGKTTNQTSAQSKTKPQEADSKYYNYTFFARNKSNEDSPGAEQSPSIHRSSEFPLSSSNIKLNSYENVGITKNNKFQFETAASTSAGKQSFLSKSYQDDLIENATHKNINKDEQKHEKIEPSSDISNLSKSQNNLSNLWNDGSQDHKHIFGQKASSHPSQNTSRTRGSEDSSHLKDSLREEELELQRLREQQEVERKRLERLREEKKVEELVLMRLKEEEEVHKIKEQRVKEEEEVHKIKEQRLKEENEIKRLEHQRSKSEEEARERQNRVSRTHPIEKSNDGQESNKNLDAMKYSHNISEFGNQDEGNPYARLARSILKESGLPYDKTTVKTIQLNKPNVFGNKKAPQGEASHISSETSKIKNVDPPSEAKSFNYDKYANPPFKPPAYFGPTFKRLNDDNQTKDGTTQHVRSYSGDMTQQQHVRRYSGSESNSHPTGYDSNINFLLYGDGPSNDQPHPSKYFENHNKAKEFSRKVPNMNVGSNENNITKNLPRHWIVEEQTKIEQKDGLKRPSYFENQVTKGHHYSKTGPTNFRERSKSGTFQNINDLTKVNTNFNVSQVRSPYRVSGHERSTSTSSHTSDNSNPTMFTYNSFVQPPSHHSRSASIDQNKKFPEQVKDQSSAADRLFPRRNSSSGNKSYQVPVINNVTRKDYNNERHDGNNKYASPSAVDSLFAYNNPNNHEQQENRQTPQSSLMSNKIFSASTTNLSHGAWDDPSTKPPQGWAIHSPSYGQISLSYGQISPSYGQLGESNDDEFVRPSTASNWPNHNRTASQFSLGPRNY